MATLNKPFDNWIKIINISFLCCYLLLCWLVPEKMLPTQKCDGVLLETTSLSSTDVLHAIPVTSSTIDCSGLEDGAQFTSKQSLMSCC